MKTKLEIEARLAEVLSAIAGETIAIDHVILDGITGAIVSGSENPISKISSRLKRDRPYIPYQSPKTKLFMLCLTPSEVRTACETGTL